MSHFSLEFSHTAEFDALAQSIAAKLACDTSLVSIAHGKLLTTLGYSGTETALLERSAPVRESICGSVLQTGQPLRVMDVQKERDLRNLSSVKAMNIGSYLGVPLKGECGATVGAICAVSCGARIWQDSEIGYLQAVADLAESRIERQVLRYEQKVLSAALAENDAILNMLSNVKGRALTVHNSNGDLVYVNAAVRADLCLSDQDMLALPSMTRRIKQLDMTRGDIDIVCTTPTNIRLNVHLSAADNGLILAEWSRSRILH